MLDWLEESKSNTDFIEEKAFHLAKELIAGTFIDRRCIFESVLKGEPAEYGAKVLEGISSKLTEKYGSGFNKTAIFRMVKFYEEFPGVKIVATLSQQLSWSHFVEILPMKDPLAREFYCAMCFHENCDGIECFRILVQEAGRSNV